MMLEPRLGTVEPLRPQSGWLWCNSGGPMSRRRTERITASLLREESAPIRFPRVIRAALHFGRRDPLV